MDTKILRVLNYGAFGDRVGSSLESKFSNQIQQNYNTIKELYKNGIFTDDTVFTMATQKSVEEDNLSYRNFMRNFINFRKEGVLGVLPPKCSYSGKTTVILDHYQNGFQNGVP